MAVLCSIHIAISIPLIDHLQPLPLSQKYWKDPNNMFRFLPSVFYARVRR